MDPPSIAELKELCCKILLKVDQLGDELRILKQELLSTKRIEKCNEILTTIATFYDHRHDRTKYIISHTGYDPEEGTFWTDCADMQLAISIIIHHLSHERIRSIWSRLFPKHDIETLLKEWTEGGCTYSDHIVYGYIVNISNEEMYRQKLKPFVYDEKDIVALLNDLTISEIAEIRPNIKSVEYIHIC